MGLLTTIVIVDPDGYWIEVIQVSLESRSEAPTFTNPYKNEKYKAPPGKY